MTVLGFWITVLALLSSLAAILNYYRTATHRRYVLFPGRVWLKISALSIGTASLLLLVLIFQHDFSNGYVYSYSDKSLPLHFLLSTFYAGQEGSFLFWVLCSAIISLMLMSYTSKRKLEGYVMTVFMSTQALLLILLIAKSPFQSIWEMIPNIPAGQIPDDGHGLNPLLQNFWMVIHPPVLFIGFAAMAAPFSFALAALWKKEFQEWTSQAFPWILFASVSLGMGLMLGAYWAYGVLGWGGYWGWDPVENSSLVPWLTSAALIHTFLIQRRTGKFVRTNFALAIVSFFLVVYSTFLTRSGILGDSSVHSFTDPGATVYWFLVGFLAVIGVSGFGLMLVRRNDLKPAPSETQFVNRETALAAGTIALVLSAAVVLFGTSLPIVSNTTVEPSFYDTTNLPIAIAIGLLIGVSLFVQWGVDDWKAVLKRMAKSLIASGLLTGMLWFVGVKHPGMALFVFASAFAFFVNFEILLRSIKDIKLLGGKLAHVGIALMFLGMIASGKYASKEHLSLPLNTPQEALGYTLTYTGYHPIENGKFAFTVVAEKDGEKHQLAPVMFEAAEQGMMRNPDILSLLTNDLYISPVSLDQHNTHADHEHETYTLTKGKSVALGNVKATFLRFDMNAHAAKAMQAGGQGMAIGSVLQLTNGKANETITPAVYYAEGSEPTYTPSESKLINGSVQLVSMNVGGATEPSTVTVQVHRASESSTAAMPEALVIEASIKPYINLLWGGTVIMIAGFILSIFKRAKEA
ncbi:MAG: cytochrome c biogenesis protein CcsA [Ignavibacteriae bacterium]|nr:cytochrome c biogenesis protein CcsA [Ignavibacteriota bacterium]